MPHDEIVRFYDATFDDPTLQASLLTTSNLASFKDLVLTEAAKRGFAFSRAELDASFDGLPEHDTFANVDFGSPWIRRIMKYGWVPKGYSR